ncbi:IS630 family transposase [Bradyrhizobium sp. RDT10]
MRYYLENRDAEFEQKMAEVLCVYREVEVLKKASAKGKKKRGKPVTIVSYDEKPGIQAVATTAPDLPPKPGVHATFARDHEYKRHGTLSLLAGIDLLTGKVHALVKDRHRSREFVELLRLIDDAYPSNTAIKLILDNHSAHISRETRAWLATRPSGRFELTFTPSTARGSISSRDSSPSSPVQSSATSGWPQNMNQGAHHGRYRRRQSPSGHPHVVLQTRRGRLI